MEWQGQSREARRSAAFTPLRRSQIGVVRTLKIIRTLKRRERRAPLCCSIGVIHFYLGVRAKPEASGTPESSALRQSQRDCVIQPRVARHELPWVAGRLVFNPNGVASRFLGRAATPLGLISFATFSQGSSFLATLGFWTESLWDSSPEFPKGIIPRLIVFRFISSARR